MSDCVVNNYSVYADTTRVYTNQENKEIKVKEQGGSKRTWQGRTDENGKINLHTTAAPQGGLTCECV